jgi:queuine tRNA-ribosyltransferase
MNGLTNDTANETSNAPKNGLNFELLATDGQARRGRMTLNHGVVETPIFMPVGTYGSVKAMSPLELKEIDAQIVSGQYLPPVAAPGHRHHGRPQGPARLHGQWDKPILTDSGGFQVFSAWKEMRKITEEGVQFASPIDGDASVPDAGRVDAAFSAA